MTPESSRQLASDVINRDKWSDILDHFIDVLRINIFIVDTQGQVILPPCKGRYGSDFFTNPAFGFNLASKQPDFLAKYQKQGGYLECRHDDFGLHSFAIPITAKADTPIAYMIVGPVVLSKRWTAAQYEEVAGSLKIPAKDLANMANEVKVVSFVAIKSILDLLSEVFKYGIQLNIQKEELNRLQLNKEVISKQVSQAAQDMYLSIYFDELLVTILDVALSMTKAECGSIMVIDNEHGDLTIKVSRGIDKDQAQNTRVKIGEGIAGLAVKENSPFVIRGNRGDNRIKHLLKRPDIKHALVMPLVAQNDVFGVLNLHTKKEENVLTEAESMDIVSHLSKLTAAAMHSIQQKNFPPTVN